MKKIPLSQGKFAIVDDEDYKELNKYKWWVNKNNNVWYAKRTTWNGRRNLILMHRYILGVSKNLFCDHINGNGLDNRKENLRVCTMGENFKNTKKRANCKNVYKGVYKQKSGKWRVTLFVNGKSKHIGQFIDIKNAAQAYNDAAKKYYGEFAFLNKI
jgi:hypothetical protein